MFNFLGSPVVSTEVQAWNAHFTFWLIIAVLVWLLVTGLLIFFAYKYRRKNEDETGEYVKDNHALETLWFVIPLVIIIVLGSQSWRVFKQVRQAPQNAYEIKVEAFQYGFQMYYPEGKQTLNELRVPAGKPIKLVLTSRDVIHSFGLPAFRIKEDMVPGRLTHLWFHPQKAGQEHHVFCSELCGPGHSLMRANIIVMDPDEFTAWVGGKGDSPKNNSVETVSISPDVGKKLVGTLGCTACHSLDGSKLVGPSFKGIYGRETMLESGETIQSNEAYIMESIKSPKAKIVKGFTPAMIPYNLSEEELKSIVEYFKTVK